MLEAEALAEVKALKGEAEAYAIEIKAKVAISTIKMLDFSKTCFLNLSSKTKLLCVPLPHFFGMAFFKSCIQG